MPQCKPSVGVYGHPCLSFLYPLFPKEFSKRLEWLEAWLLSTNCLLFDSYIGWFLWFHDLKKSKEKTYLQEQNRCYLRPIVQSSNMECSSIFWVWFIGHFRTFCCNSICCTGKTNAFLLTSWLRSHVLEISIPYLICANNFSMSLGL